MRGFSLYKNSNLVNGVPPPSVNRLTASFLFTLSFNSVFLNIVLLLKKNFLFFIDANVFDISGPFCCPLSGKFLFLRLNKILVAASLGHSREPYGI